MQRISKRNITFLNKESKTFKKASTYNTNVRMLKNY